MSVHSVHSSHAATHNAAPASAPPKQAQAPSSVPEDKVTISSAARAKQANVSRSDADHDGK